MTENQRIRNEFNNMLIEKGLKMKFVSKQLGFENTTVSKWRNEKLDYGQQKLNQIEEFIINNNKL